MKKIVILAGTLLLIGCASGRSKNPFDKLQKVPEEISFKYDQTKNGGTLLEDVPFDGQPFAPDIVEFLKQGESGVDGDVMRARAKELNANLGQRHLEYLEDHQELIPKEWQDKYYLIAMGTVWQDSLGIRRVPCLH